MIALWMFWATLATLSFALAAWALDGVCAARRWPRRWVWVAALAAAMVVLFIPRQRSVAREAETPVAAGMQVGSDSAQPGRTLPVWWPMVQEAWRIDASRMESLQLPAMLVWGAGSLLLLALWGAAARVLARQRREWRREWIDGESVFVARDTGPAVVGLLRPQVVLPEWALELPLHERQLMQAHEREHVRARDPLLLHAATAAVIVMPWNLAAWWLARRLRLAVEFDCDSRVLRSVRSAHAYGALLVSVGARRSGSRLPVASLALLERPSSLERRITAMFSIPTRVPRLRAAGALTAVLAGVLVACEPPSAEMLGPSGKDEAARTVYGGRLTEVVKAPVDMSALVADYFPEVIAGVGPQTLVIARDAKGTVVLAQRWDAEELSRELKEARMERTGTLLRRKAARTEMPGEKQPIESVMKVREVPAGDSKSAGAETERELTRKAMTTGVLLRASKSGTDTVHFGASKIRLRSHDGLVVGMKSPSAHSTITRVGSPDGLSVLSPDEIQSIEVVKYGAGRIGPDAISVILVTLR